VPNPLVDDRLIRFLLTDVYPVEDLLALDAFSGHDLEVVEMFLDVSRRFARRRLFPTYRPMDEAPPALVNGEVAVHPLMHELYPQLVELGTIGATRPESAGGAQLPHLVATLGQMVLMAGNAAAMGYPLLTAGAAHLIEIFGNDTARALFLEPMMSGRWTGTMALTEPQAGSSLGDVLSTATPTEGGRYLIRGTKIFISGGMQDLTDNVVHLTLARIDGAPVGSKGVSLFAVPRRRPEPDGELVDNDVKATQLIHKIGWRGLPSLGLTYGEDGDCHGWLIGPPNGGLRCMFQMMNEARLMVGANGAATASVAYHEAVAYALERTQGRPASERDPSQPQRPIIEHADVRRMLLRQRAIVDGAIALVACGARYTDLAAHGSTDACRSESELLLGLLTPIIKSFPAEYGYEADALALQVHGGYGYSSEYLPEAWLRDQKLNSLHEGTTGIQALDLLGRKAMGQGGAALRAWAAVVASDTAAARAGDVDEAACDALDAAVAALGHTVVHLGQRGAAGRVDSMLASATDFLTAMSITAVAWQWLRMMTAAGDRGDAYYGGLRAAGAYWFEAEVPRVVQLAALCRKDERAYEALSAEAF